MPRKLAVKEDLGGNGEKLDAGFGVKSDSAHSYERFDIAEPTGALMMLIKSIALMVPAIRSLHEHRNQLAREVDSLLAVNTTLTRDLL